MKRIYHPYWKWEETNFNMWGKSQDREGDLNKAIDFTGDHKKYGEWMMRVVDDWPYSCEHNLTDKTQNRKAWIGHAAVAYWSGIPEDIVRKAWGYLTDDQRDLANKEADKAIREWERRHAKKDD